YPPEVLASFEEPGAAAAHPAPPAAKAAVGPAIAWLAVGVGFATMVAARGWDRMLYVLAGMCAAYGVLVLASRVLRPGSMLPAIVADLHAMPAAMRRLAVVQFFSWFALFAMWIYT